MKVWWLMMIALINAFALIAVDSGLGPRSDQNWYLLLLSKEQEQRLVGSESE
jgi:hypothetical protein